MSEEMKKFLYWGVVGLMSLIALVTFYQSYQYDKQKNEMVIKTEESSAFYKVDIKSGPTPYVVDLYNIKTKEEHKNVQLYATCPMYNKVSSGVVVEVKKEVSFRAVTGEKIEKFIGGYDQLCKNKPLNKEYNKGY